MKTGTIIWIADAPHVSPDWAGMYCMQISIQRSRNQALVDSGSNQAMVRQSLIKCGALGKVCELGCS